MTIWTNDLSGTVNRVGPDVSDAKVIPTGEGDPRWLSDVAADVGNLSTDKLDKDGDGSDVTAEAAGGTAPQRLSAKLGERLSVFDIAGVVADGVHDDSAALSLYLATTLRKPGPIYVPESAKVNLGSSVTFPPGWTLIGPGGHGKVSNARTDSFYNLGGQVKLASTASLRLINRNGLVGLLIIQAGLSLPVANYAAAMAFKAACAGTAVICADATAEVSDCDIVIADCMFIGFNLAISGTADRMTLKDLKVDSKSGILLSGQVDISRLRTLHVWPFVTVEAADGLTLEQINDVLTRDGYGFRFDDVAAPGGGNDWTDALGLFTYGHNPGYQFHNVSGLTLAFAKADYKNPLGADVRGFDFTGHCDVTLVSPTAVAQQTGVRIETTSGLVKILSGSFASVVDNIDRVTGHVMALGNSFHSGSGVGVRLRNCTHTANVAFNFGENIGALLYVDPALPTSRVTTYGNVGPVASTEDNRTVGALRLFTPGNIAEGIGAGVRFRGPVFSGEMSYGSVRPYLKSATTGSEAVSLRFASVSGGTETDRWELAYDGHLLPLQDNAYSLGSDTYRISKVAAALVSTSNLAYSGLVKVTANAQVDSGTAVTLAGVNAIQRVRLTGNATITLPTLTLSGSERCELLVELVQDGTGNRTVTWATQGSDTIDWDGSSVAPSIATTAGYETKIVFMRRAGSTVWQAAKVWQKGA